MNIVEEICNNANAFPDRPALIGSDDQLTYRQLVTSVAALAAHLAGHGVQAHTRVGLQVVGARPMILTTLALGWLGAVSITLPTGHRQDGDGTFARACGVTHLLHNFPPERAPQATGGCAVISLHSLQLRPRQGDDVPELVQLDPSTLCRVGTSSGTTGRPKAISSTLGELLVRTHLVRAVYPIASTDRMLVAMAAGMPFAFHYWLRPLHCGAAVAVPDNLAPRALLEIIHRDGITVVATTPATAIDIGRVAAAPGSPYGRPAAQLHTLICGGGSMTPATQEALRRHVCPGLSINYGSSEAGLIAIADTGLQQSKPRCAGRVVPWMELQAVNDAGEPLPHGHMGRLRMRSMTMAQGYLGDAGDEPGVGFHDGWFYSGDRGRVRSDGLVYLAGRANEVINLSGGKMDAARLEGVVAEDPQVVECAVVAIDTDGRRPFLVAVVVASTPVDKEAIMRRCAEQLGPLWAPKAVLQVDKLPRNEAGKLMRERLRKSVHVDVGKTRREQ